MRYRTSQRPTALWVVIGLNLLLFLVTTVLSFAGTNALNSFYQLFALIPAYVLVRPWTVLTSIFIHSGFGHILANMITLYFFGSYLLVLLGQGRFLLIYFSGGIAGSICYVILAIMLGAPFAPVVGASGAVFALGGALAVMRPRLRVIIFPIPLPIPIWVAVIGGFLILSAFTLFTPLFSNVAWQAHLGGLLAGLAAGFYYRKKVRAY